MNKELPNLDAILEFTDQFVGGGEMQNKNIPKYPFKSQSLYINNYKIFRNGDTSRSWKVNLTLTKSTWTHACSSKKYNNE